ncbi:MAG TPA: HAMP domain-containing sensor histidine kinase [Longimicrobiales bacterium]|nr:HAMP domain-containing sensor histidine kinase [Longimicrobiales bacterium]
MNGLSRLSLRSRFLLLVLLGVVLPLGLVGVGIVHTSRDTGVELVRIRLADALEQTTLAMGRRWSRNQSELLDLGETQAALGALTGSVSEATPGFDRLAEAWERVSEFAWLVEITDPDGEIRLRLPDDFGLTRSGRAPPPGFLNYDLPLRERLSGTVIGTLRVRFRSDALLDPTVGQGGLGGSVLAVVDRRSGISLTPIPLDPARFEEERFTLGGEEWLSVGRDVTDPPVRLWMAAPLGPVTTPLGDAARRGILALLLAVVGTFVLVTLFSRRLTRPLEGLSRAATAVAGGDLSARADEVGPPDVRETAAAFNAMVTRLRETLDRMSKRDSLAAVGEFAANLAHEVRNPLTSIRMDLERCGRKVEEDPAAARALAHRALHEIDRLNASLSDVLHVARDRSPPRAEVDLRVPLGAAVRAASPRFTERRCVLTFQDPEDPVPVVGDGPSLEQLFLNLLLNAAEASPPGGSVRMTVERNGPEVTISVADDGPGIPAADRSRIFEPLVTTKPDGTGLGLPIARRIARAHGTEIEVESGPGAGATFSVRLRE